MQLHDGRVIIAKLNNLFQRLGGPFTFDRYEPSILRATELSFDAGPPIGQFSQLFKKHRVDLIEYHNGR